jgi:uncharacterized membrane protein YtjA (UPF0391 family)
MPSATVDKLPAVLQYAVIFFIIAMIAALFGFTGTSTGVAQSIAKILFFIFLVAAGVTLLIGLMRRGS